MVQRFHELVAAVRVARKVGLANAGDNGFRLHLIRVNGTVRVKNRMLRPGTKVFGMPLASGS